MKTYHVSRRRPLAARQVLRWHRRAGLILAAFILLLSVTGIVLNHAQRLGLHEAKIENSWVLDWYGMQPARAPVHFATEKARLLWLEGALFLNGSQIANTQELAGALTLSDILVAATTDEILLLTPEGEIVERLNGASIPPGNISRIANAANGQLIAQTSNGLFGYDESILNFNEVAAQPALRWSEPTPPEAEDLDTAMRAYRGDGLSLYRVILDMHSGRFFTRFGPWVADLTALGLIALTLSGIYYAMKTKTR